MKLLKYTISLFFGKAGRKLQIFIWAILLAGILVGFILRDVAETRHKDFLQRPAAECSVTERPMVP